MLGRLSLLAYFKVVIYPGCRHGARMAGCDKQLLQIRDTNTAPSELEQLNALAGCCRKRVGVTQHDP